MNKRSLTEKEAAEYIGMSCSFLRQDRMNGFRQNRTPGPNYVRIGRAVRYLREELDKWLETNKVERTA
jgi:predicted DNA-binding transcriptional regulator AlpA